MGCCHYFDPVDGGADTFTVEMPRLTFGRGAIGEVGARARGRGLRRVGLFTDAFVARSAHAAAVRESLTAAGVDYEEFADVEIEPSDESVMRAAGFVAEGHFDGIVSLGGGSVMDTAKAALVYAAYPAEFTTYFAPPVGGGVAVPGPVKAHIACPTTSGTGSEVTGLSVIRLGALNTKFVLQSRYLLPVEAIVDPACAATLPATVIASSGVDLLSHAFECYTAKAYTHWKRVADPDARVMIQGANPWSDLHAREALEIVGRYLERGVRDATDTEARDQLMWAATLAGSAFGNSGTHLPHALSYAITHLVSDWHAPEYPGDGPFVPHGISVILNAPSVFRFTARAAPERHLTAAKCLGADTRGAGPEDAGEVAARRIVELMRKAGIPNGIGAVGFAEIDAERLAQSAIRQGRAIANAPREASPADVADIFRAAVSYW